MVLLPCRFRLLLEFYRKSAGGLMHTEYSIGPDYAEKTAAIVSRLSRLSTMPV